MASQQLIDYINQEIKLGDKREKIESDLLAIGWQVPDIADAFNSLTKPVVKEPLDKETIKQIEKSALIKEVAIKESQTKEVVASEPAIESAPKEKQVIEEPVLASAKPKKMLFSAPKNIKKILIIFGIVLAGLALIGGGVLAYNAYFYSPEKNIQKMMIGLKDIKAIEYSGELKVVANIPATPMTEKKVSNFLLSFSGLTDNLVKDDSKNSLILNLKSDLLGKDETSIGLEMRSLAKFLYFKFTALPNIGFISLDPLANKWMKFEQSVIDEGIKNNETLNDKLGTSSSTPVEDKVSADKVSKLNDLFKQSKVIKITETLKSEVIEGRDTYHYKYVVDKEALKKFISEANPLMTGKPYTAQEIASSSEQIDKLETIDGEISIGKKDYRPYKVSLNIKMKATAEEPVANQSNLTLLFKNFNVPAKVEAPQDAKPFMEVISGLMGGMSFGSDSEMLDDSSLLASGSEITSDYIDSDYDGVSDSWELKFKINPLNSDTDGDGLSDSDELDYGTDPNNSDTDDDSFVDGQEVKGGYNPLGDGKLMPLSEADKKDYGPKDINTINSNDSLTPPGTVSNSGSSSASSTSIIDALESARIKARDARRISDIKTIQTALEMYYNEMNYYPSVKEFNSKSIKTTSSVYMATIPIAPLPVDGKCLDKNGSNRYTYKTDSKGATSTAYTLTFCLGNAYSGPGTKTGVNTASPEGINR